MQDDTELLDPNFFGLNDRLLISKKLLDDYEIQACLGEGSMGKVFKVYNKNIKRIESLKILKVDSEEIVARFQREIQMLSSIKSEFPHVHIPEIFFSLYQEQCFYYTMEYIEGTSLAELLETKNYSIAETIDLIIQLTKILDIIHSRDVLHRDIKPSNVLVDKEQKAWLLDFGIAKQAKGKSTKLTLTGYIVGTPQYMSPEQAKGKRNLSVASDIYSLGTILYEMIALKKIVKKRDFTEMLEDVCFEDPVPPIEINKEISIRLNEICLKTLKKNEKLRYQKASELRQDLEGYLTSKKEFKQPLKLFLILAIFCVCVLGLVTKLSTFGTPIEIMYNNAHKQENILYLLPDAAPKIKFHKFIFGYMFIYKRGEVVLEKQYCFTPQNKGQSFAIDLSKIMQQDWFFLESKKALEKEEIDVFTQQLKKKFTKNNLPSDLANWKIYLVTSKMKFNLIYQIKVLHRPFEVEIFQKSTNQEEFLPFLSDQASITKNSQIQLKITSYQDFYVAIFLYKPNNKTKRIFPEPDSNTYQILKNQKIIFPQKNDLIFKNPLSKEYLYFFYSQKNIEHRKLEKWLKQNAFKREYLHKTPAKFYSIILKGK